ncbi:MAG: type IV secretory system conjugative DNA transfer family protein [Mycoplasmataceae bacterium]|jgi:type IV secretion system protein VirD4|nr:type IV secretory system conjugative DNA transfer family protein [Mycoplasmataceae bacterium]
MLDIYYGFNAFDPNHWSWAIRYSRVYGKFPEYLVAGCWVASLSFFFLFILLQIIATRLQARTTYGGRTAKDLHGSARWATTRDIKKAGLFNSSGVVVGGWSTFLGKIRPLRHDGPEHILIFAPTRSGKGISVVIPTLLYWKESALVLDIKGENWIKTSGYRSKLGQRILKFDPASVAGGLRFNPLAEVRISTDYQVADAQNIAAMIIDPDGKGLADFWAKSGFSWLTATILFTLYKINKEEGRVANLTDVDEILTASAGGGIESLLLEMINFDSGDAVANEVIHAAGQEMTDRAGPERSGVQSSSKVDLAIYRDPIVAKNIAVSDFRLCDLMDADNPASLYLIVPPQDIDRLRPLLRVILNLFMRRLLTKIGTTSHKHRLLLMLDEFTSIGKLEIFERSLAFMAGYGLKAVLIVQNLKQLQGVYGRDNAIMGNCNIRVATAPNDIDTANILSQMCGKATVIQTKRSRSRSSSQTVGNISENSYEVGVALITPDECMRLIAPKTSKKNPTLVIKPGAMLTFISGYPPILGQQPLYFLDKDLLSRSEILPIGNLK